ncbi:MAG: heavy-metal-associated domain-containing protein [Flavobacteriaceae bacterium]
MKKFLVFMCLMAVFTVSAQEKSKSKLVDVKVSGNCEMCKARIEKAAFKVKGVKSAEWHPDDKVLHLVLNEYKTDVLTVEKGVASVGHDTEHELATNEAYEGLHNCCKYEREFKIENCKTNCSEPCCKDKAVKPASCCVSTSQQTTSSCQTKK